MEEHEENSSPGEFEKYFSDIISYESAEENSHISSAQHSTPAATTRKRNKLSKLMTKSKRNTMSDFERRLLIETVKKYPAIWDISREDHSNNIDILKAWKNISRELNKSDEDCKSNWKSLLASRRYKISKSINVKKSGDPGGEPVEELTIDDDKDDSNFSVIRELSFIPDTNSQRKTVTSDNLNDITLLKSTNYNLKSSGRSSNASLDPRALTTFTETMTSYIQDQQLEKQNTNRILKNYTLLAALDEMMEDLPKQDVEDLIFEFMSMVRQKKKLNL